MTAGVDSRTTLIIKEAVPDETPKPVACIESIRISRATAAQQIIR